MSLSPRGSQWAKWDLHVHTPASLVHQYPGEADEAWEAFISDLESLPSEFQALGINDYWFLDGYSRLRQAKDDGRIPNIQLLLPVVEIRLTQFGGTESRLSKVNYHVIFSDDVSADVIRAQFLSALSRKFQLVPRLRGDPLDSTWGGIVTRDSLKALGAAIKATVPEAERSRYRSDLEEGFNNLTVSLEAVTEALGSTFLQGKVLTAVGKTEWADIKWKDGSIADKKHVVNAVDCVFTAADSFGAYEAARRSLAEARVNSRLLDCSDAHHLSSASHKDRIGNAYTWIKADPTFGGLLQAVEEFEQRVFIGDEPPQHRRIREHPSKYLDRVRVEKLPESQLDDPWFDADIQLNPGLVAVIGNKGSGKSALAEVIGLVGGSPHADHFSFLTPSRFRNPRDRLADHFVGRLTWLGEGQESLRLTDSADPGSIPRVQHLPQRYLESLCNEVPSGEKTAFDAELERIIFAHLPVDQRLGVDSLEAVIEVATAAIDTELATKRESLSQLNRTIANTEAELEPQALREVTSRYHAIRKDWLDLRRNPPVEVPEPDATDPALVATRARIQELNEAEGALSSLRQRLERRLGEARRQRADLASFRAKVEKLKRDHDQLREENRTLLEGLGVPPSVSSFTLDLPILDDAKVAVEGRIDELASVAEGSGSNERALADVLKWIQAERVALRQLLSGPEDAREAYIHRRAEWEKELRVLLGPEASTDPDSLCGARRAHFRLRELPDQLNTLRAKRRALALEIHGLLKEKAVKCAAFYAHLQAYMDSQELPEEYWLSVATSLVDTGLADRFLHELVNRQVSGSFSGVAESTRVMGDLLSRVNFDDAESVISALDAVDRHLRFDMRELPERASIPRLQVRKGVTVAQVYDWVFGQEYLSPRYGLRFGGKPIYQLSPGEKGTLLLIFFLLAELDTRPLIIDQPEDNLDNNTVFRVLVRCFQKAKARRQVIMVTHNPNLAVVCDADQIIVASMEKGAENRIQYTSGAIERTETIRAIVDILEGTHPAFRNRSVKYNMHLLAGS